METMEIMEQLAMMEPKGRRETKGTWDQGEIVAIMDQKEKKVIQGFHQNSRYNIFTVDLKPVGFTLGVSCLKISPQLPEYRYMLVL